VLSVEDPDESVVANEADITEQLDKTVDNEKVHSKAKDPDLYRESSGEVPEKDVDRQILRRRMENKSIAMSAMIEPLKNLVSGSKDALEEVVGAAKNQRLPLQVILAIDEGSKCTRILRGILRFPDIVKDMVCSTLSDGLDVDVTEADIDVQTSVAGTGVASATIGSVAPNFVIVTPYHELDAGKHKVYAKELRNMKQKLNVPWRSDFVRIDNFEVIKTQLPVVAMLMENGRMASIAISQLRAYEEDAPVNESHLVDNIVRRFMRSNGLNPLVGKENATKRQAVAAAALAVHLFSSLSDFALSVPERAKIDSFARKMKFFTFDSLVSGLVSVRQLVVDYGLLEPSDTLIKADQVDTKITPPLQMKTAQQLIAVHMLGISLTEMLDPSWIGFEAMSTHFVKCAIAASVAVPMEKRPSLQRVLKTLGFQVDNNATHQDVCGLWEEMDSWCAVAASPLPSEMTPFHWETRQLRVELAIKETYLQVDKSLYKAIESMLNDSDTFAAPIACINYGNSDLPDGIVTFYAKQRDPNSEPKKWSIMVQAKDYHSKGVDAKQLNEHAEKAGGKLLDGLFGEKRLLLCVAGTTVLCKKATTTQRNYLPFAFQHGKLVADLLASLTKQRSSQSRVETFACDCGEDGEIVTRKRPRGEEHE